MKIKSTHSGSKLRYCFFCFRFLFHARCTPVYRKIGGTLPGVNCSPPSRCPCVPIVQAWLNGTHGGDELLNQVKFVKFFAAFLLEHTEDKDGSTAVQLAGLVITSDISLERMQSGANYFGFMPGYTPRTTISTIMLRIDALLPFAESTEEQLQTYDATVSTSDDIRSALDSANQMAAVDLGDQRNTLAELDETMASQLISINEQQREIARQWQGDDEAGIKGLVTIQAEFVTALTSWEEPSTGPNWFKIGLLITGAVVSIAITVGTGGTAGVAVAGAALAAQAAKAEQILEVLDTGISVSFGKLVPALHFFRA